MANNYVIDYTDPLSGSFTIPDAGFDGPGGKTAQTTLRLYGRGAPEWGESVDENLVKLLENFMSATEPLNPKPGQLWVKTYLYYRDISADQFYAFNLSAKNWATVSVTVADIAPSSPATGQYWFEPSTNILREFFQAYKQTTAAWHVRQFTEAFGAPSNATYVLHELVMFDAGSGTWVAAPVVAVAASSAQPASSRVGSLRFDPTKKTLNYWDGGQWVQIGTSGSNPTILGDLNMGSYRIVNLHDPVDTTDALNLRTGDARYVNATGDSMTGALTLSGPPTQPLHAATKQYVDDTATAAANAVVAVPSGVIVLWSGAINAIPSGWVICDGANGTPDLRDRFVIGAGLSYAFGVSGGNKDAIVVAHNHTISSGSTTSAGYHVHTGSTSTVADHTHGVSGGESGSYQSGGAYGASNSPNNNYYGATGPAGSHNHTLTINGDGLHTHNLTGSTDISGGAGANANLPPYYALAYIMKSYPVPPPPPPPPAPPPPAPPPAPVASFTANPTTGTVPLAVSFTDTSTNSPTTWSWTFGDGATSTAQNPSYTYTSTGSYAVSLVAGNSSGQSVANSVITVVASAPPPPPPPPSVPNPYIWWDMQNGVGTYSGSDGQTRVNYVADRSGNGHNLTSLSGFDGPTLSYSQFPNGAMCFAPITGISTKDCGLSFPVMSLSGYEVFILAYWNASTGYTAVGLNGGNIQQGAGFVGISSSPQGSGFVEAMHDANNYIESSPTSAGRVIVSYAFSGQVSTSTIFRNNTDVSVNRVGTAMNPTVSELGGQSYYYLGNSNGIAEVRIYNQALTSTQRTQIINDMWGRWA